MSSRETTSPMAVIRNRATGPQYFYQRFASASRAPNPDWPRITTDDSSRTFEPRDKGLKILLINPPIREWSYPNIMPIGQGYIASVAAMDGHHVSVLDLNAARLAPVKDDESTSQGF